MKALILTSFLMMSFSALAGSRLIPSAPAVEISETEYTSVITGNFSDRRENLVKVNLEVLDGNYIKQFNLKVYTNNNLTYRPTKSTCTNSIIIKNCELVFSLYPNGYDEEFHQVNISYKDDFGQSQFFILDLYTKSLEEKLH